MTIAGLELRVLRLVGLCSLPFFLDCLIPALMGPLAAPLSTSLSLGRTELGAVFSANLVGQCLGLLVVPLATGRLGHRRIILWTTVGFGISQGLTTFVDGRDMLVFSRFVTGVFLGGALPSCVAAVTQGTPPGKRGLATMLLFTAFGLGGAVAGFYGSLFLEGEDWRYAFATTGAACLVAAVMCALWLEEPPPETEPAVSTGAGAPNPRARVMDIVRPPLLGGTLLLWLMFVCALTIYYCLSSWLPTLLVQNGWSLAAASRATSLLAIGGLATSFVASGLADRGRIGLGIGGAYVIAAASLALCATNPQGTVVWFVLLMLIGCSMGTAVTLGPVAAAHYPADLRATGVGFANGIGRIGSLFGPLALAALMNRQLSPPHVLGSLMVPLILCALLIVWLSRVLSRETQRC